MSFFEEVWTAILGEFRKLARNPPLVQAGFHDKGGVYDMN